MKKIYLFSLLLVVSFLQPITNFTYSQNWTNCYNGMFNGAYGVNCLEKLDNYIFADINDFGGTENSKVYRSSDNGVNWYHMNTPGMYVIYSLFATGTNIFAGTLSNGLFYSSDYGLNWIPRGFNTGSSTVNGIGKSGPNLLIYVSSGLCYSTNNGLNWITISSWPQYKKINSFLNYYNTIFAACFNGVFFSNDDGMTWFARGLQSITETYTLYYFQGSIYAGTTDGMFKSTNEGLSWSSCNVGINDYYGVHSINSVGNLLFAGTVHGMYCSSNEGNSWYPVNSGIGTSSSIDALLLTGTKLYAGVPYGTNRGIYATTNNGQNWLKAGLNFFKITSLIQNNNILFVGTDFSGVYYSSNEGSTWYPAKNELNNNYITSLIKHGSNIFAGTLDSGIYKSTNNGQNWSRINSGLGNFFIKTFYSKDTLLYSGTNSGIYKTTNNGSNWTYFGLSATPINAIITYNNYLLSGTNNGIQITSNNGINWTSGILSGKTIKVFYFFKNKIYSGTDSGMYYSTNNGFNWNQIGLTNYSINSITNFLDTLTCSTSNGVYVTSNNGVNWIWLGPRNNYFKETKSILTYNGNIYASGIIGNTIYDSIATGCILKRIASTQSGIRNISNEIVSDYFLYQNYPNPFNPSTIIKFNIPNRSPIGAFGDDNVVLKVYNIMGRLVTILINEKLHTGSYEVTFDGGSLSSGIYFYQLRVDDYVETKRMVLIK